MSKHRRRNGQRKSGLHSGMGPVLGMGFLGGLALTVGVLAWAQAPTAKDPGARGGTAGAGFFQPGGANGLTANEQAFEQPVTWQFEQTFGVTGTSPGQPPGCTPPDCTYSSVSGLGPRFNSSSCSSCHAPAVPNSSGYPGGASPWPSAGGGPGNPLFGVYQVNQSNCTSDPSNCNRMPNFFETANGPVLVPRFPYQLSNTSLPDGLVHQLFTITNRSDGFSNCSLSQPNFALASQENDLVFRQPLPTFGDGYVEMIENTDILNNLNSNLAQKQALGIGGVASIADDGSVNRLGWKAQWRAILPAAGAEENVEMGVTNEMFPTETDQTNSNCLENPIPEDSTNYAYTGSNTPTGGTYVPWNFPEGADRDAVFIRFLNQPTPGTCVADTTFGETSAQTCSNGLKQFNNVGCALCHTVSYNTPAGSIPSMGHVKAVLYSDLLLHHMGNCLADNIVQGNAQGDMWRTPPLWNVGQRWWFLHDGRTSNIVTAIEDHADNSASFTDPICTGNSSYQASEADAVIQNFNTLSKQNQQDLIYFLRSL